MKLKVNSMYLLVPVMVAALILFAVCNFKSESNSSGQQIYKEVKGDYPYFSSEEEIYNEADVIISGSVDDVTVVDEPAKLELPADVSQEFLDKLHKNGNDRTIGTLSKLKIIKVYKGDLNKDDVIDVYQYGCDIGTRIIKNVDAEYLKKDNNIILFLKKSETSGRYYYVNPIQAFLNIDNGKFTKHLDNSLFKDIENDEQFLDLLNKSKK